MTKKNKFLTWYDRVCDLIEVYLPCVIFVFMFLSYVVLIVYRYLLRASFDWLYELNMFSFVWCGIFAASYGSRSETHVRFTILYDHVSPRTRMILRFIEHVFVIVLFSIMLPKAVGNLDFMKVRKSSILKLRFNWVFAPFLSFVVLTILHNVVLLSRDVVSLFRKDGEEGAKE